MPVLVGGKPPKKPFRIKGEWLAIGLGVPALLMMLVIANSPEKKTSSSASNQPSVTAPSSPSAIAQTNIFSSPVLGATKASFDSKYGVGLDSGSHIRYQNDYLLVTFIDDTADYVLVQFEQMGKGRISKDEALVLASPFLPDDSVKIGERQHDEDSYVVEYSSQKLAQTLSEDRFYGAPAGSFIVIIQHDPNNRNSAFAALIATGNNP